MAAGCGAGRIDPSDRQARFDPRGLAPPRAGVIVVGRPVAASSSTDRVADFESEGCRFESYLAHFRLHETERDRRRLKPQFPSDFPDRGFEPPD